MHFGGAMFFTDYSMSAMELARALEERGFDSVWAPEHSHIPLSGKTPLPGGGDLPKQYYDAMDPFVVLAAAGQVTKTIKLGTGVLLVQQRDVIQTAKLVASIDQVSQDGSCMASAEAGTRTKWKTTGPSTQPASNGCVNPSRR
jgi:alkanesulfonate monooxygenase SsuD/methylene tetrahydromethanopterin reductase-like flavin-dependent oxidoreductase (luciferase family)